MKTYSKPTVKVWNVELQHMIAGSNDTVVGFKNSSNEGDHNGSNALGNGRRDGFWGNVWGDGDE